MKLAEHVDPQLIPLGELDTLPGPETETSTEKNKEIAVIDVIGGPTGGGRAWWACAPPAGPGASATAATTPRAAERRASATP